MRTLLFVFFLCVSINPLVYAGGIHDSALIPSIHSLRYAAEPRVPPKALVDSPLMQGKLEVSLSILKDGKTPEVRLFEDKGDIAYRINKFYFKDPNPQRFVKSRFLGLRFKALDVNGDRLQFTVVGDPNEITFETEISRTELESGKEIKLKQHKKKSVPLLADAYADSEITLKWNVEKKILEVPSISGKMRVDSFIIGRGESEKSIENLTTVVSEKRIAMPPFIK